MAKLPENFIHARILTQKLFPYWQQLLWSLEPVEMPGLGTVATDRYWRFYFDREEVSKWSINDALISLIHEVIHITNRHHLRGTRNDNIAADMAVNSWIDELIPLSNQRLMAFKLKLQLKAPDDWVHPTKHNLPTGLTLEDYRELLPKQPNSGTSCVQVGSGQGTGQGGQDKPHVGCGSCGSCAHKEAAPWELPAPDEGGPPGLSEASLDVRIKQVAQAIREYGQKAIGSLPGFMSRWAERELKPPTIHWTKELASAARAAIQLASGATYRSWRKLNRRSPPDVLFPGMQHPIPNVAMVVDVSGSMSEKNVQDALTEAQGVIKELSNTPVPVLAVDAAVNVCKKVCDMRKMPLVGGGGTDMSLGVQSALDLKPKPQVVIVFTDGHTGWPQEPPRGAKVIAVLVDNGPTPPDWIRTIRVVHEAA